MEDWKCMDEGEARVWWMKGEGLEVGGCVGNQQGLEDWISKGPEVGTQGGGHISVSMWLLHPPWLPLEQIRRITDVTTRRHRHTNCVRVGETRRDLCWSLVGEGAAARQGNRPPSHCANLRERTDEERGFSGKGLWELDTNMRERVRFIYTGLPSWLNQRHRWLT